MKQIISLAKYDVLFGGDVSYLDLSGVGSGVTEGGADWEGKSVVMPIGGTFRNLQLYSGDDSRQECTGTFVVNGVETDLTCTLAVDPATTALDDTHEVTVDVGDLVVLKLAGTRPPDFEMGFSLEFEGEEQFYASQRSDNMEPADEGERFAGALGNGFWVSVVGPGGGCNTHSIVAAPGTITGIYVHSYLGPPDDGTLTVYIDKSPVDSDTFVKQDGTGDTINTGCVLDDTMSAAFESFNLPVVPGEKVQFVLVRNGTEINVDIAASLTFTPDDDKSFMMVGGSNTNPGTYVWNATKGSSTDILHAQTIVGPEGFIATGLYMEFAPPSFGTSYDYTLLKNGEPTAITLTIAYPDDRGFILLEEGAGVTFEPGDLITIASPDGSSGNLYWGLIGEHIDVVEEELSTVLRSRPRWKLLALDMEFRGEETS